MKIALFAHCILTVHPEQRNIQKYQHNYTSVKVHLVGYNSVCDNTDLHSFTIVFY